MENTNEMKIVFDSRPENEGLARVAVAAFCTQLNPTLEEVSDLKTAVSEAVTNCIIHAYEGKVQKIEVRCRMQGRIIWVDVIDKGIINTFWWKRRNKYKCFILATPMNRPCQFFRQQMMVPISQIHQVKIKTLIMPPILLP